MDRFTFDISTRQKQDLNNLIILTGAPRSGTTLLGKIISTLKNVEYHFEPPTLYMISCLVAKNELPRPMAEALVKIYLYEDLFLESVHGRKVNLRPTDDSLILNSISWENLGERWASIRNRNDAIAWFEKHDMRLAFKMPNIMDSLNFFCDAFPQSQIVIIARDGRDVVRSMLQKRWLEDDALENELWPYQNYNGKVNVPYWVEPHITEKWDAMNAATRSCYMWQLHARIAHKFINRRTLDASRLHVLKYEDMLHDPKTVLGKLSGFLKREMTPQTRLRIEEIRKPPVRSDAELTDFYKDVKPEILKQFKEVNELWGYPAN